jgi:hypothetical protein
MVLPMLNWMQSSPYANSVVQGPYHLMRPFPERRALRRVRAEEKLPGDLPDYCLFVTRHALLAFTTSLMDVSSEAHDFFAKLNYCFALDRMMRSFMAWGMPTPASSAPLTMLQPWFAAAVPLVNAAPSYFGSQQVLPPRTSKAPEPILVTPQDANQVIGAAYAALMVFSAACLNAAPAAMDAWGARAAA